MSGTTIQTGASLINGGGSVAKKLYANGFDAAILRPYIVGEEAYVALNSRKTPTHIGHATNNATLLKDEWIMMDEAIIKAYIENLSFVKSLKAAGLTYTLPNPLKHTVLQHQNVSDAFESEISMDANIQNKNDQFETGIGSLPIPIVSAGFNIDVRQLAGASGSALPLDTTNQEMIGRANARFIENQTLFGKGNITEAEKASLDFFSSAVRAANRFTHAGASIDGIFSSDQAVQYTLGADWLLTATSGPQIVADVTAMKQKLIEQGYSGNFRLTLPTYLETSLDRDYKGTESSSVMSILGRLRMIGGVTIDFCDSLGRKIPASTEYINMCMVAMQSDVIRIVDGEGFDAKPVEWDTQGGMNTHYRILTIQVPQIRTRQAGDCGICIAQFQRA